MVTLDHRDQCTNNPRKRLREEEPEEEEEEQMVDKLTSNEKEGIRYDSERASRSQGYDELSEECEVDEWESFRREGSELINRSRSATLCSSDGSVCADEAGDEVTQAHVTDEERTVEEPLSRVDSVTSPSRSSSQGTSKATSLSVLDEVAPRLAKPPASASKGKVPIISVLASLYLYDRQTGFFAPQDESVKASFYKLSPSEGSGHWLLVHSLTGEGGVWVSQGVNNETMFTFAEKTSMVFRSSIVTAGGLVEDCHSLLRLPDGNEFSRLQSMFEAALLMEEEEYGNRNKLGEEKKENGRKEPPQESAQMVDDNREAAGRDQHKPPASVIEVGPRRSRRRRN
ncbi:hypothetical protein JCM5350_003401 [Sporobolomyces pararoseus]